MEPAKKKRDFTEFSEDELDEYILKKKQKLRKLNEYSFQQRQKKLVKKLKKKAKSSKLDETSKEWISGVKTIHVSKDLVLQSGYGWNFELVDGGNNRMYYSFNWGEDEDDESWEETSMKFTTPSGKVYEWDFRKRDNDETAKKIIFTLGLKDMEMHQLTILLTFVIRILAKKYEMEYNSIDCDSCLSLE